MQLRLSHLASPLGDMLLVTDAGEHIRALDFADHRAHLHRLLREQYGSTSLVDAQAPGRVADGLARYFAGELDALAVLPTATAGSTLQLRVWAALARIPVGTTTTYGKLARELGFTDPRAAIDIGAAVGSNPIAIVVPCHRVIASSGDLKGYAWGLHRKRWLLEHEQAIRPKSAALQTAMLPGF
ncbi:methylated-DNA--[protein]-cysteine S-methyltransferase [Cupriavidus lacunae]|uniref:methylated-DNA--[protein]-cysteine S-methyltransferase n=1 Tax=Cupriavidus lacunae TaxID=2666307 RepID=A0A370MVG3_9BURK|nr:methylated-DNA--[protein]-cysteine S-methyltransferase [Cupriavidus lacunae]RDJ97390.1 cysteine methyltransferase [Cupriavidus lacunae]